MSGIDVEGVENEGEKYLEMLDLGHLVDAPMPKPNDHLKTRDFLDVCGEHALPVLKGFEAMSPEDPRFKKTKEALQKMIGQYIEIEQQANGSL